MITRFALLPFLAILAFPLGASNADEPIDKPIAGILHAERVAESPRLTSAGMAWWKGRLMICDRVSQSILAHTPPNQFETWKKLTPKPGQEGHPEWRPVGCAVDPQGRLIVTQKGPKDRPDLIRIVRYDADGAEEELTGGDAAGAPHFLTIHTNGTIYWSGFPDGGTRYMAPGGEVQKAKTPIGHTYGIGLSPKQDWLYVASKLPDPHRRGVHRFPLDEDGIPGEAEFFLQVESLQPAKNLPDLPPPADGKPTLLGWVGRLQGLAVDRLGYLYIAGAESHTSGKAVAVIDPTGKEVVAMILDVPTNISGLAFGGEDRRTLYITGAGDYPLFQVRLPVAGR